MEARIDNSGLKAGIAAAKKVSKRSAREIVNTSAYWIAVNAKNASPFVTPNTVDSQLGVIRTPKIGKRGQPLKGKFSYKAGTAPGQKSGAPLAALIVVARARPGSRYNTLTSSRYALQKNPFAGVSRAAGAAAMRSLVDKMTKTRHSATKFLLSGWIPVVRKMWPHAVRKYLPGASPLANASSYHGAPLGTAQPATGDGSQAEATIENDIGLAGVMREKMNSALLTKLSGPLQAAVDREGANQMKYALSKLDRELSDAVIPDWG